MESHRIKPRKGSRFLRSKSDFLASALRLVFPTLRKVRKQTGKTSSPSSLPHLQRASARSLVTMYSLHESP